MIKHKKLRSYLDSPAPSTFDADDVTEFARSSQLEQIVMQKPLDANLAIELGKLVKKQFGCLPPNFGLQLSRKAADLGHGCSQPINIIFDGPPGPNAGRFIEVETDDGKSITVGEWINKGNGMWSLRITDIPSA